SSSVADLWTITPRPRSAIRRLTACATRNIPRRFTARIRSQSATAISRNGSRLAVPALLISTSMPFSVASAALTSRATWSALLTSQASPMAWPCWARTATAPSTSAGTRPATNTREPSSRKRSALARPIPLVPPVISTPLSRSPRTSHLPSGPAAIAVSDNPAAFRSWSIIPPNRTAGERHGAACDRLRGTIGPGTRSRLGCGSPARCEHRDGQCSDRSAGAERPARYFRRPPRRRHRRRPRPDLATRQTARRRSAAALSGRPHVAGVRPDPVRDRSRLDSHAVCRPALYRGARRHRPSASGHRDRHRGRADGGEGLHVQGAARQQDRHRQPDGRGLPKRAPPGQRVRQWPARAPHRLVAGVLPGRPGALQSRQWSGYAEIPDRSWSVAPTAGTRRVLHRHAASRTAPGQRLDRRPGRPV